MAASKQYHEAGNRDRVPPRHPAEDDEDGRCNDEGEGGASHRFSAVNDVIGTQVDAPVMGAPHR
jgi:hypothetical protein